MDQWDAEGAFLFKPWIEGTLRIADLFRAHGEHRIVPSRILALGLLQLNHQWDARLEMTVNAIICGGIAVALVAALTQLFEPCRRTVILWAVGLWLALPYGYQNILWGFQSAFNFLILFSLLAMWGLGLHRPYAPAWWTGTLGLLLACLSMATGFFSAIVVIGIWMLRFIVRRIQPGDALYTCALCMTAIAVSFYFRTAVPHHQAMKVSSPTSWAAVLASYLAWPFCDVPSLCLVMYLPVVLLVADYVANRNSQYGRPTRQAEALIALAGWSILQAATIAYARGGGPRSLPASRYMDIFALGTLANLLSCIYLVRRLPLRAQSRRMAYAASICWIAAVTIGAVVLTVRELKELTFRENQNLVPIEQSVRAYVATGDSKYLRNNPAPAIPYPDAGRLATLLTDAAIRTILPAAVRAPLPIEKERDFGNAFVSNGYPSSLREPPYEHGWGSYSAKGVAACGAMESNVVRTQFPYLQIETAGYLGAGMSLALRGERTNTQIRVSPSAHQNEEWHLNNVAMPDQAARIISTDSNSARWFGFREPRELGRFSYYADLVDRWGCLLSLCGFAILIWSTLLRHGRRVIIHCRNLMARLG